MSDKRKKTEVEVDIESLFEATGVYIKAVDALKQFRRYEDGLVRKALVVRAKLAETAATELNKVIDATMKKYLMSETDVSDAVEKQSKKAKTEGRGEHW